MNFFKNIGFKCEGWTAEVIVKNFSCQYYLQNNPILLVSSTRNRIRIYIILLHLAKGKGNFIKAWLINVWTDIINSVARNQQNLLSFMVYSRDIGDRHYLIGTNILTSVGLNRADQSLVLVNHRHQMLSISFIAYHLLHLILFQT